jgi:hypothetical protein
MIESSSLREHDTENNMLSTPTKSRGMTMGNEENQENMINSFDKRLTTPNKSTPSKRDSAIESAATVSARREWLRNFGKQHANHYRPGNNVSAKSSEPVSAPGSAHKKQRSRVPEHKIMTEELVSASALVPEPVKRKFTPRKIKVQHTGTQATDDGRASVAKLSQWLSNDPTSSKAKAAPLRRGKNISYKSRKFERGQEGAIVKESHILRGSVSNKKNWLKNAFTEEEEPVDELTSRLNAQYAKSEIDAQSEIVTSRPSTMSVAAKKSWLKNAFGTTIDDQPQVDESRSVIITDDAASSLSVSDKKSWLQNAFNNSEGATAVKTGASPGYPRAATDVMHSRGENRNEMATRAKNRFRQRSSRRLMGTPSKSTPSKRPTDTPNRSTPSKRRANPDPITEIVSKIEEKPVEINHSENTSSIVELKKYDVVEEDNTPVDFRAARELLVQRSRKNGNQVEVRNKVNFKMSKFEEIERERKRTTEDIALKRPFDEMLGGLP